MALIKWHVHLATLIFLVGAPSLLGQDFLKQLTDKLSQKQKETKGTDQPPATNSPTKETGPAPFELPSVLETEGMKNPRLRDTPEEVLELPAPKSETPPPPPPTVRRSTNPTPPTYENPSAATPPAASPFQRGLPNNQQKVAPGGGGFLGLEVESNTGGGFGLTVVQIKKGAPAWKAGFLNGDKIIGVAGQAVSTPDAFAEQLSRFAPGAAVKFLVDRRGKTANVTAILQDPFLAGQIHGMLPGTALELDPNTNPAASSRLGQAYFGVNVSDMSDAYRRQFGIAAFRGASVTEVVPNSPAHSTGLKPGDCIVEIEGVPVQTADVVFDTISRSKPGQVISFSFYRGRQLNSASVALISNSDDSGRVPSISREMLTPEYVASLQGELERVNSELSETQTKLQQLEARLQRMENKR